MEKKISNKTKIEYFTRVVEKIGQKVVPTSELYEIFVEVDKEMGIVKKDKSRCSKLTTELMEVLGEKDLEVVVDTKPIGEPGRRIPRWFSLKIKDISELNIIKGDIIGYFEKKSMESRRKMKLASRKKKGTSKVLLKRIWNFLLKVRKEKSDEIPLERLREISGCKVFNSKTLSNWQNAKALKAEDVKIEVKISGSIRDRKVKFVNLESTIFQMYKLMRLKFPDETFTWVDGGDTGRKLIPIPPKPVESDVRKVDNSSKRTTINGDVNEAYVIYAAGGVIKENGGIRVYSDVLATRLREDFGISIVKKELISILKKEEKYFDILGYGDSVKLKDDSCWVEIKDIYGPQNYFRNFLVRLGMSTEEILQVAPDLKVELVSRISDFDGIYKITYNRTMHHRKELVKLFRTFRQNDKILDDTDLENDLQREVDIIDARSHKDNFAYRIENL